jgi:hypothetical protein
MGTVGKHGRLLASTLSKSATYILSSIFPFTLVNKMSFSTDDYVNTLVLHVFGAFESTPAQDTLEVAWLRSVFKRGLYELASHSAIAESSDAPG